MTIQQMFFGISGALGYLLQRSVRLRSSASAYFNRTFVGTPTTFTISFWLKRGIIGTNQRIFGVRAAGSIANSISFTSSDILETYSFQQGLTLNTTAVFRDPSAWYHFVVSTTTGNTTVYCNNIQVATSATAFRLFNSAAGGNAIGRDGDNPGAYFDGYLEEINFIDGQALTPSSFGEYNTITGVWQPKKYSGTYGTNGFYLNFNDNSAATATTIGADSSGNGNNWTPNNISVTAGVTYDSMTDVPTLTSPTTANFAVFNPLSKEGSNLTISNGNLTITKTAAVTQEVSFSNIGVSFGAYYWEMNPTAFTWVNIGVNSGLSQAGGSGRVPANTLNWYGTAGIANNAGTTLNSTTYAANDVLGFALNATNDTLALYKNNTLIYTVTSLRSNMGLAAGSDIFAFVSHDAGSNSATVQVNFGQRPFTYTPPSGFVAINTYNLPDSTISNGANQFAATLYTGTGSSLTIANTVNSVNFQPDFVWVKSRSVSTDHALYDSVRGTTKQIESNTSAIETTEATGLTAFGSTGFTVGALAQMNTNAATYVGWQWKASNAAAVTNTAGTITSSVSANTTAGFSIVSFTGVPNNASTYTIGHGLGIAPKFIIAKNRDVVDDWYCYQEYLGATKRISLNTSAAVATGGIWGNTAPTSSVFSLVGNAMSSSTAQNLVAYCFAEIAGYSKFGGYTGNGSADGPFIYLGFRPRFLMIKKTDSSSDWWIWDTSRNTVNQMQSVLYANLTATEFTDPIFNFDDLSNGFKNRSSNATVNGSGATYIYAAFAENPFKNSLAR